MPMCASVTAIGRFSPEIADCLDYPASFYSKTKIGSIVATDVFQIFGGSHASREFAALLGISDPWDFNQHAFDPRQIDADGLRGLFRTFELPEDHINDLDRMLRLREHGFQMIFRPNG